MCVFMGTTSTHRIFQTTSDKICVTYHQDYVSPFVTSWSIHLLSHWMSISVAAAVDGAVWWVTFA